MPGYSGTPLPKKLGIKPGFRVQFSNAPADVLEQLAKVLVGCSIQKQAAALDFAMLFAKSRAELKKNLRESRRRSPQPVCCG